MKFSKCFLLIIATSLFAAKVFADPPSGGASGNISDIRGHGSKGAPAIHNRGFGTGGSTNLRQPGTDPRDKK